MNCKHAECTENVWILLILFPNAKANNSAILNDNILKSTISNGSNGDMERSSTNPKSHEGESGFETGKVWRAPFMNLRTKRMLPHSFVIKTNVTNRYSSQKHFYG